MIEEFGGRPIKAGQSFSAAFIVVSTFRHPGG
jgi:hypothetical protein